MKEKKEQKEGSGNMKIEKISVQTKTVYRDEDGECHDDLMSAIRANFINNLVKKDWPIYVAERLYDVKDVLKAIDKFNSDCWIEDTGEITKVSRLTYRDDYGEYHDRAIDAVRANFLKDMVTAGWDTGAAERLYKFSKTVTSNLEQLAVDQSRAMEIDRQKRIIENDKHDYGDQEYADF